MPKLTYRGIIANLFMRGCSLLPLQDKVVLSSFDGKAVSDNPRAIYLEMKKMRPDLKYVWVLRESDPIVNEDITVKPYSFRYIYHLATSKLWIDNSRKKIWTVKRKNQYYVQTWHGDISLKMIEKDAEDTLSKTYIENAKYDASITDLMVSGSDFGTKMFRNSFWYNGEILEYGAPKSAVFYTDPAPYKKKVCSAYCLQEDIKLVLYCPTFRNTESMAAYNMNYAMLADTLEKQWGGKWAILVRLHPKIIDLQNRIEYSESIINASGYPATNDLIMASDLIITDYSSCMFEGMEAQKTVFLYASDVEEYLKNERGMYFDIKKLPFPLAQTMEALKETVMSFNESDYLMKIDSFKRKIGLKTNSLSAQRTAEFILDKVWKK